MPGVMELNRDEARRERDYAWECNDRLIALLAEARRERDEARALALATYRMLSEIVRETDAYLLGNDERVAALDALRGRFEFLSWAVEGGDRCPE